jgi:signal transduction histidine kinase
MLSITLYKQFLQKAFVDRHLIVSKSAVTLLSFRQRNESGQKIRMSFSVICSENSFVTNRCVVVLFDTLSGYTLINALRTAANISV